MVCVCAKTVYFKKERKWKFGGLKNKGRKAVEILEDKSGKGYRGIILTDWDCRKLKIAEKKNPRG